MREVYIDEAATENDVCGTHAQADDPVLDAIERMPFELHCQELQRPSA
jgi:hypothetical protein